MKTCNICKEFKDLTEFSRHAGAFDGYHPSCRSCVTARDRQRRKDNAEKYKAHQQQYYEKTKEKQRAAYTERYQDPVLKAQRAAKVRQWKLDNPERVLANLAYRRARKLQATPSWADKEAILAIYKKCVQLSNETGIPHQVDHIIPLNGKLVCGLHIETNLQIIPASDNNIKNNSFDPETFQP